MATYYVSTSGSNTNDGLSPATAWRNPTKVNATVFNPGDQILFQGGAQFTGPINMTSASMGASNNPIIIGSYGTGKANIRSNNNNCILLYNTGGYEIRDLIVSSSGTTSNAYSNLNRSGINIYRDETGTGTYLPSILIDNVEAVYCRIGIGIGGDEEGYDGITVTNCVTHDCRDGGISVWGGSPSTNKNAYIAYCEAYNMPGHVDVTTAGISVGETTDYTIEYCVAHDLGEQCTNAAGGPVGIGGYDSTNGVIQYNLAYNVHTPTTYDGVGFNLDINTTNCTLQYNLAYNNDGAGFLLYSNTSQSNCVVRYNVGYGNGRVLSAYGEMFLSYSSSNAAIYNNTFIARNNTNGGVPVFITAGTNLTGCSVRNNVFIQRGSGQMVSTATAHTTGQVILQGNAYYSEGGTYSYKWGGTTYSGIAAWRAATNQEKRAGVDVGFEANPLLVDITSEPAITEYTEITTITNVMTRPGSPLIAAGLNLNSLFGINPGSRDYFGQTLSAPYSIGAHQGSDEAGWQIGSISMGKPA